jgi:hypothetical protein
MSASSPSDHDDNGHVSESDSHCQGQDLQLTSVDHAQLQQPNLVVATMLYIIIFSVPVVIFFILRENSESWLRDVHPLIIATVTLFGIVVSLYIWRLVIDSWYAIIYWLSLH